MNTIKSDEIADLASMTYTRQGSGTGWSDRANSDTIVEQPAVSSAREQAITSLSERIADRIAAALAKKSAPVDPT